MKELPRIFHDARCARREKCSETVHPWPVSLWPTVCVGPVVPTQTVGSKFLRYASEFASASMHLLARTCQNLQYPLWKIGEYAVYSKEY